MNCRQSTVTATAFRQHSGVDKLAKMFQKRKKATASPHNSDCKQRTGVKTVSAAGSVRAWMAQCADPYPTLRIREISQFRYNATTRARTCPDVTSQAARARVTREHRRDTFCTNLRRLASKNKKSERHASRGRDASNERHRSPSSSGSGSRRILVYYALAGTAAGFFVA